MQFNDTLFYIETGLSHTPCCTNMPISAASRSEGVSGIVYDEEVLIQSRLIFHVATL